MNFITIRFFVSIFLIFHIFSFGQNLRPNESLLTMSESQYIYHIKLRQKILNENFYNTHLTLVVLPSFDPEYALRIIQKNENYFGVVTTTNENIWYSEDYDNLKLISFLLPIKSNDAQLLIKSSDKVLLKTKYTDSPNFAVDGVRYIFGNSSKSGTFRSGDRFKSFELIKILEEIIVKAFEGIEFNLNNDQIEYLNSIIAE